MASTAAKVGIGCLIAAVLGVLLLGGGGYFFYQYYGKDMIAAATETVEEGKAFGRDSDERRCLDTALDRYRAGPGVASVIKARIFLQSCLETSTGAPGFCDGVPGPFEFSRTISWREERCDQAGLAGDQVCPQFFEEVQKYCTGKGSNKQRPAAEAPAPEEGAATPTPAPRRSSRRP
jgi:hypothetical protein